MTEATTRADIKTKVSAVTNVGKVYDYERWTNQWDTFLSLFETTISSKQVIRGWTISCESFSQTQITYGNPGCVQRDYTYKIRGYFGLDDADATEKTAMVVVEDVVEALEASVDTGSDDESNLPADLTVFEPRMYGNVLCHYAEITLTVTEYR